MIILERPKTKHGYDFAISYNPDTRQVSPTHPMAVLGGDGEDGGEETAIVVEDYPHGMDGHIWNGTAYFILKGDFRKDYLRIAKENGDLLSFWDCKYFYDDMKKKYGSRHSTDFRDWGRDGIRRTRARRAKEAKRSRQKAA